MFEEKFLNLAIEEAKKAEEKDEVPVGCVITLNGKVIAASIMIFANGRLNYHLSGSLREYQSLAPSNLMLWKAAEWGNENGCATFHLGGGVGSADDGLFKFKRAFYRGELYRYQIGKKIFNRKIYQQLVLLRKAADKDSFFPEYRG